MIAAIPAEDRPTIRVHRATSYPGLMGLDLNRPPVLNPLPYREMAAPESKRCLSCGAKTNEDGELPCDH